MSKLFDDASLAMIPSAYKDNKLYSIRPTDGSGDFTFSRGSNLAATRVDVNGLIEKGRENLLLQSNSFNTTWTNGNSTESSGQSGYDGTSDAWLLESTATATSAYLKQNIINSGVYTMSVYAKAGTSDWLSLNTAGNQSAYFDLANGVLGSKSSNVIDSSIESIGNGWYRCSATLVGNNDFYIFIANGNNNLTTNNGDNILIQDAQRELGLVATDYIETGTSAAQSGILEDMPRLDYSGGASCPSLLLEPQRSNTFPNSEYLSGYSLARTNGTNNSATSPEGIDNAFKLYADTQTGAHYMRLNYTKTSDAVLSVFAKKGEETSFAIGNASFSQGVVFNLENGTITSESGGTGTIEDMGNNWYRCSYHRTAWADWQYIALRGNNTAYTGDGSSGIYLYGIQFEDGSYPTSYIPTYGTSQTRSGDSCYLQNADVHSSSAGTIFFEVGDYDTNTSASGFNKILVFDEVNTTSLDNVIYFEEYAGNNTILIRKGGSTLLQSTPNYQDLRGSKVAIKWSSEGAKVFIDGVLNNSYVGDASLDIQYFGFDNPYNGQIISTIKMNQLAGFPTALTDSECIALTTL